VPVADRNYTVEVLSLLARADEVIDMRRREVHRALSFGSDHCSLLLSHSEKYGIFQHSGETLRDRLTEFCAGGAISERTVLPALRRARSRRRGAKSWGRERFIPSST
jgi:hypothetical protein